jgi:hypothetical protein
VAATGGVTAMKADDPLLATALALAALAVD